MSDQRAPSRRSDASTRARGDPHPAAKDSFGPTHPSAALQTRAGNRATAQLLGAGRPLSGAVRSEMEARFDTDFASVRIHSDPGAAQLTQALHAQAFTHGEDVVFNPARYDPTSRRGKHLLAHELAHVIQQRRGGRDLVDCGAGFAASLESAADSAADSAIATAGPVTVAGASAPGVALAPEPTATRDVEPDRTELSGSKAWREWLEVFGSMRWDDSTQRYTTTVDGRLHVWDERTYQERRANVAAYFAGRVGNIRANGKTLRDAREAIQATNETWKYKPLFAWLEYQYGVEFPAGAFEEEIVTALAYAYQAEQAINDDKAYLQAFDYLESARASLETATILLENYRDDLVQASESAQIMLVGSWGDAVAFLLGAIKGALTQLTDLADTGFWLANEMKTDAGGIVGLAGSNPQMVPLAVAHDLLKSAGAVDAQGRVSTTAVAIQGMDALSSQTNAALGSALGDELYFTPGELGELAGALGLQVGTAALGVREIQFVFDAGGALSSARTMVNTYRDKPDWMTDTSFWSGLLGLFLGVVGLGKWSGQQKLIDWILRSGVFASAAPVLVQLERDAYDERLDPAERDRRVKEDLKRLAQILLLPVLQPKQAHPVPDEPNASPTPTVPRTDGDTVAPKGNVPAANTDASGAPGEAAPKQHSEAEGAPLELPPQDAAPLPDNILPYRTNTQQRTAIDPEGELVDLYPSRRPDADAPAQDIDAIPMELPDEAALPLAVGHTPSAESIGPMLIHDADAIVASSRGRNGRPPPTSPGQTGRPTPTGASGPGQGPRRASTPGQPPPPAEQAPRVFSAERDRQIEVIRDGKTLYLGKVAEGAAADDAPGGAGGQGDAPDAQARLDALAPGPVPTEPMRVQLEVDLGLAKRRAAEHVANRRERIAKMLGVTPEPPAPVVRATGGPTGEVFEPNKTLYLTESATPATPPPREIGLEWQEPTPTQADIARRSNLMPGPEPTGPLEYLLQPSAPGASRSALWKIRFAQIKAAASKKAREAQIERANRAFSDPAPWLESDAAPNTPELPPDAAMAAAAQPARPDPIAANPAPMQPVEPTPAPRPGTLVPDEAFDPPPLATSQPSSAPIDVMGDWADIEIADRTAEWSRNQLTPRPARVAVKLSTAESEEWPHVWSPEPRGEWMQGKRGERVDLGAIAKEQAAAAEWPEVNAHRWDGAWTDSTPRERIDLGAPAGHAPIEQVEPTLDIAQRVVDPDDEPTVRMERHTFDPDAPTEELPSPDAPTQEIIHEPNSGEVTQEIARDSDASEATEEIVRDLDASEVTQEITVDAYSSEVTQEIARDSDTAEVTEKMAGDAELVPAMVEVETTDPGSAPDPGGVATRQAAELPAENASPEANVPAKRADAATPPRQLSIVPPDEQERVRRRKKNRNKP